MNLVITGINNKNYNYLNQITFRAKVSQDVLRKTLADDEFISSSLKITVGEFKKIFFDTTMNIKQKTEKLKISYSSFLNWAKTLGIKKDSSKRTQKNITKEQFDKIFNLDIPEKEKIKRLVIPHNTYYSKMLEFGYTPELTARKKAIRNIKREDFEKVFFDKTLTEDEKHKKLGLTFAAYLRKADEFQLTTTQNERNERINSITKEEFDKVFFIKNLGIRHKCHMLGISEPTFTRMLQKYGYKTKKMQQEEYIRSITKEQFDRVFYDESLTKYAKAKALGISRTTYKKLVAKFGHASEVFDTIRITRSEFDKVFFDDTLSRDEKVRKLGTNEVDYYYLIDKFGYKTKKQERMKYIRDISKKEFLAVANDETLSEDEKFAKLKISQSIFRTLSIKYGYESKNVQNINNIKSISKEEFDKVFFDNNLTFKEKVKALKISDVTFMRLARKYGYTTKYQENLKKVDLITKEVFDEVYKQSNLTVAEKIKKLGISGTTYRKLRKQFGYTSEK